MVAEIKIMKIALSNQEFGCFGAGGIWYSSWFMNTGVEICLPLCVNSGSVIALGN